MFLNSFIKCIIAKKNLKVFKKKIKIDLLLNFFWRNQAIANTFNPAPRAANTGKSDEPRVNHKITATQVRLIDEKGQNVGVVVIREAMRRAESAGLDLVEIAANGNVPVCKIIDAGKYKYELQKRKSEAKKKQKVQETKEIKFTPNIGENDYGFKMRNAKKFLAEGNKVKFTIRFRGREMSYQDLGAEVLNRAAQDVADIAKTEGQPKLEGRNMSLIVSPTK